MNSKKIYCADLFCGAGGFSSGLLEAAAEAGVTVDLLAVNHWPIAVETHSANHPAAVHYCESIEGVEPRKAVPGGRLDILLASPCCTHHSNARGGKPMNDQSRATAWHILRWAEELHVENIVVENVREFRDWGPLGADGRPIQSMKGRLYRQFLSTLRALGYTVDERILNAADFGGATTRQRLFIQARKGRRRPAWPLSTHIKPGDALGILDDIPKWRGAREIIDWSFPGASIYSRKKPLAPNTMARILAGLHKYSGLPFLVPNFTEAPGQPPRTHSVEDPLPTVTGHGAGALVHPFLVGAGGPSGAGSPQSVDDPLGTVLTENHKALCQPFLVVFRANQGERSLERPVPALTTDGGFGLCEPFITVLQNNRDAVSVDAPLPTVLTSGAHFALAEPFIVPNRTHGTPHTLDEPIRTLTTGDNMMLCEPFIVPVTHSGGPERSHNINLPLPTVTCAKRGEMALCEPYLTEFHGGKGGHKRVRSVDDPVCTLDTSNRVGLAQPFLISYYGQGDALSLADPLDTVTSRDRFALVDPRLVTDGMVDKGQIVGWLDIRFRMLQPHELAAAMSFPEGYHFAGNREAKVKQIGNAVEVRTARALCKTILEGCR